MELIKLLGVLIVIVGFALKLDSILIIFLALIATGIVGGLGVGGLLETIGTNFVANRSMAIFIMILLVTGTLERNGLREAAANLIRKVKSATAGKLVAVYGMLNALFGAFNVSFGGVAGFIRPVLLPMIEGAISNKEGKANEDHVEEAKGLAVAMQNFTWFFFQVLFTLLGTRHKTSPQQIQECGGVLSFLLQEKKKKGFKNTDAQASYDQTS